MIKIKYKNEIRNCIKVSIEYDKYVSDATNGSCEGK